MTDSLVDKRVQRTFVPSAQRLLGTVTSEDPDGNAFVRWDGRDHVNGPFRPDELEVVDDEHRGRTAPELKLVETPVARLNPAMVWGTPELSDVSELDVMLALGDEATSSQLMAVWHLLGIAWREGYDADDHDDSPYEGVPDMSRLVSDTELIEAAS